MKNKLLLVGLLLVGTILLAGCQKKTDYNQNNSDNKQSQKVKDQQIQEQNDNSLENNGLSQNIKKLFQSQKKIRCVYRDSEIGNNVEVVTYIDAKNKHYRTEFTDEEGVKNIILFDGKTSYMWREGNKKGTKMNQDCIKQFQGTSDVEPQNEREENNNEPTDIEAKISQTQNVKCGPISSIDLSLPKDVEFVDQCAMLKKQQEALQNISESMKNMPVPSTSSNP